MLGIITQTTYPYTTSYQLARRYQKFLDGSRIISSSDKSHEWFAGNPNTLAQFDQLLFVVEPPNTQTNVPPGVSVYWVPLWNHLAEVTPGFVDRTDRIICHTFHTAEVVDSRFHCASKIIHCPLPLAKRPLAGDSICRKFFMVVGRSFAAPNPRCPWVLDLLNQTDEFHINLFAIDQKFLGPNHNPYEFKHVHTEFGLKRHSDEIYVHGGDVMILPSKREALGLPIYEGIERGIPTIAFRIPTIGEACFDDWTVEPFNLEQFRRKMADVFNSNIYYHKYRCMELLQRHNPQQFTELFA